MTELNQHASLEERYIYFHNLDPDYPDDQDEIKEMREMREMDDAALETEVKEAQECNEYMADSWYRKHFGMMFGKK